MPGDAPRGGRASARSLRSREIKAALRERPFRSRRVVVYLSRGPGEPRAAVIASRRVGGAVQRNRARRLLREAWRAVGPRVRGGHAVVLVARPGIAGARANDVVEEVAGLLSHAGVMR